LIVTFIYNIPDLFVLNRLLYFLIYNYDVEDLDEDDFKSILFQDDVVKNNENEIV
jgi:hypothetical protein